MGCEMSWGVLRVGLGVLCPFRPLPSPRVGNVVLGGDGGASHARGPVCTVPLPLLPLRAQDRGNSSGTEGEQDRDSAGPPGLGTAVNRMEIYFKGGEKTLLTLHHSRLLVGKIRMA